MAATDNMGNDTPQEPQESLEIVHTRKNFLIGYHNAHLRTLVAQIVNVDMLNHLKDGDTFAVRPTQGPDGKIFGKKITVKEERDNQLRQVRQNTILLKTIEKLLKAEGFEVPSEANGGNLGESVSIPKV